MSNCSPRRMGRASRFVGSAIPSHFAPRVGSQEFMLSEHGLTPPQICETIKQFMWRRAFRPAEAGSEDPALQH